MTNYAVQWRGRAVGPLGGVTHFDPEWIPSVYRGVIPRDAVARELQTYDHQAKGPVWYAVNDPTVPVEPALLVWRVDGNGVRLDERPIMRVLLTHEWREHVAGIPPEDRQWRPGPNPAPGVHVDAAPKHVVAAPPLAEAPQPKPPPAQPQPTLPTKPAPPLPVLVDKSGISRSPTAPVRPTPKPAAPVLQERQPLQGPRLVGIRERVNAALQRAEELGVRRAAQQAGTGAAGLGKRAAQQLGKPVNTRQKQQMGKQRQKGRRF